LMAICVTLEKSIQGGTSGRELHFVDNELTVAL